jgi:hypothetical protein
MVKFYWFKRLDFCGSLNPFRPFPSKNRKQQIESWEDKIIAVLKTKKIYYGYTVVDFTQDDFSDNYLSDLQDSLILRNKNGRKTMKRDKNQFQSI